MCGLLNGLCWVLIVVCEVIIVVFFSIVSCGFWCNVVMFLGLGVRVIWYLLWCRCCMCMLGLRVIVSIRWLMVGLFF